MCLSCGCGQPFEDHGDPRNITMEHVQQAANGVGITVPEVLSNIQKGANQALSGMTDWTGDQQRGGSGVLDTAYPDQPPPSDKPSRFTD